MNGRRAKATRRRELLVGTVPTGLLHYMLRPWWGYRNKDVDVALGLAHRTMVLTRLDPLITKPGGRGRRRKHATFEGLMMAMTLNVVIHGLPPHLSEVTETLYARIPKRRRPQFQSNHPYRTQKQRNSADRATERMWAKLKALVDGEPLRAAIAEAKARGETDLGSVEELRKWAQGRFPEDVLAEMDELRLWVCNRIVWATASILFEEMAERVPLENLLLGMDATYIEANSQHPTSKRPASDDQAGWYVRENQAPRWGFEGHILHLASDPTCEFRDIAELALGVSLDRPGVSPERNGLAAIRHAVANGLIPGTIGFDNAYNTPLFKLTAMAMGFGLLYKPRFKSWDDHPDYLGAVMAGGHPLCPGVEPALLTLRRDRADKKIDTATMYARAAEREKFRPWVKEQLPDGRLVLVCPALAPANRKPRCCCPLRPDSYDAGVDPEVPHPPGVAGSANENKPPGPLCVNKSITVDPLDHTDRWQDVAPLTPQWRRDFAAGRNSTERGNANAKASYSQALERKDRRGLKGMTNNGLLAGFMLAGHNFRLIASWLKNSDRDEDGTITATALKNRRGKRAPKHARLPDGTVSEELDNIDWDKIDEDEPDPPPVPGDSS